MCLSFYKIPEIWSCIGNNSMQSIVTYHCKFITMKVDLMHTLMPAALCDYCDVMHRQLIQNMIHTFNLMTMTVMIGNFGNQLIQ